MSKSTDFMQAASHFPRDPLSPSLKCSYSTPTPNPVCSVLIAFLYTCGERIEYLALEPRRPNNFVKAVLPNQ